MDWMPFALVGGICIVIGFLVASLIYALRRSSTGEPEGEPETEDLVEVVRLWRRKDEGVIVPEIKGQLNQQASDLNADQHADLSLALVDLYQWLLKAPFAAPTVDLNFDKRPKAPGDIEALPDNRDIARGEPGVAPIVPESPPRPSLNPLQPFLRARRRESAPRQTPPERSIASQIDDILQAKLANSPLAELGIRLIEWPVSGMRILIGMDQYDEIDSVPDDAIRSVIREAVAEWEARMLNE